MKSLLSMSLLFVASCSTYGTYPSTPVDARGEPVVKRWLTGNVSKIAHCVGKPETRIRPEWSFGTIEVLPLQPNAFEIAYAYNIGLKTYASVTRLSATGDRISPTHWGPTGPLSGAIMSIIDYCAQPGTEGKLGDRTPTTFGTLGAATSTTRPGLDPGPMPEPFRRSRV